MQRFHLPVAAAGGVRSPVCPGHDLETYPSEVRLAVRCSRRRAGAEDAPSPTGRGVLPWEKRALPDAKILGSRVNPPGGNRSRAAPHFGDAPDLAGSLAFPECSAISPSCAPGGAQAPMGAVFGESLLRRGDGHTLVWNLSCVESRLCPVLVSRFLVSRCRGRQGRRAQMGERLAAGSAGAQISPVRPIWPAARRSPEPDWVAAPSPIPGFRFLPASAPPPWAAGV
jgi:hypothetical protein